MYQLGRHLIVEFYNCNHDLLNDLAFIRNEMLIAAKKAGATVVGEKFHAFEPIGVSGVVVLKESHLSVHTWPEHNYAAMDFFTCGNTCDPYKGFEHLRSALKAEQELIKELSRGLPNKNNEHD